MLEKCYFVLLFKVTLYLTVTSKHPFTLDEFFNYTQYPLLSFSPIGNQLLVCMKQPSMNSNTFENHLWLYDIANQKRKLITHKLSPAFKPEWSPSGNWIVLSITDNQQANIERNISNEQQIYFYSAQSHRLTPINIGTNIPLTVVWAEDDSAFYFAVTTEVPTNQANVTYESEWRDAMQHRNRKSKYTSKIYRAVINMRMEMPMVTTYQIITLPFSIGELVYSAIERKLVFTSAAESLEILNNLELYSIDLQNTSSLVRLTYNEALEQDLQLSNDGTTVLFQLFTLSSSEKRSYNTQQRLYSVNLRTKQIQRLVEHFHGSTAGYAVANDNNIYVLGQLGVNVQIYSQRSTDTNFIVHPGWSGVYETIAVSRSLNSNCSIAVIYSSLKTPKEVYCIRNISQIRSARAITNENGLLAQRILPDSKIYTWQTNDDNRTIEGILHYPPGKVNENSLPLLVLIHGGPYDASLNHFQGNGYFWAPLAALDGWLVLEPNYRGSIGYGDQFVKEILEHPLIRPGNDILSGIDNLIKDGIADSERLAIGGYSYGGSLTNWLITQTTCFNVALPGAGSVEPVSLWGAMDMPVAMTYGMRGMPWENPNWYQNASTIYYLNRVRTPTHIVTGAEDIRVPPEQSFILERGLYNLGVPVQLLIFPGEGHSVINSRKPSYGKIKVREELKWLRKYGHRSWKNSITK